METRKPVAAHTAGCAGRACTRCHDVFDALSWVLDTDAGWIHLNCHPDYRTGRHDEIVPRGVMVI